MKKKIYKSTITFRVDPSLKREIVKAAKAARLTRSAYVEQLVKRAWVYGLATPAPR